MCSPVSWIVIHRRLLGLLDYGMTEGEKQT
jgi:hypothetical protein